MRLCVRPLPRRAIAPPNRAGRKPSRSSAILPAFGQQVIEALGCQPPVRFPVEQHPRRASAIPKAIHGFQRELAIGCGLAEADTEAATGMLSERDCTHRLARLGLAKSEHVVSRRLMAKVMIEGDHAVDLG